MNMPPSGRQNHSRLSNLHSRPLCVTLIVFGVLIIAGFHLIRCIQAMIQWQFLAPLLNGLPLYLGLSGLIWTVVWLPLAWGLWRGDPWAFRLMRWATPAYGIYFWLDRLILRTGLEPANLPFTVGLTILLIVFVFWTLSKASVRAFIGDRRV